MYLWTALRLSAAPFPKMKLLVAVLASQSFLLASVVTAQVAPIREPNESVASRQPFAVSAVKHIGRGDVESLSAEGTQRTEGNEARMISPPTRSSFITSWSNVAQATGYRLDVSTDSSFCTFVSGYQDLNVGNVTGYVVTGLHSGTTYYYRVRAYNEAGSSANSEVMTATTKSGAGLIISATFDSSITSNPNAVAIESMINQAVGIFESLFSDPINVSILFRYSPTAPDGTLLETGDLALSNSVVYVIPWNSYITPLKADATTANDTIANASLSGNPLSIDILPSSANGRAIGLNTVPAMFANGTIGNGGPFDGIVTLNSTAPFQFTRPPSTGNFDAMRATEHEIDEVLGLGSYLNGGGSNLRPQDLFSWSSPGNRNLSSAGSRYFSINGGNTQIVAFNQDPNGDFGDWLSGSCPQANPFVQNAFGCPGQSSDVTSTSPEGINLDVIGYNLVSSPPPVPYGVIDSPVPGSTLTSSTVIFEWAQTPGIATAYIFSVGDKGPGTIDIFDSGQTAGHGFSVKNLPTDGRTLYVRLWSFANGSWYHPPQDYTYTAFPGVVLTPIIAPNSGTYQGSVTVNITTATPGAKIYYTTNGSSPTTSSTVFTAPFTLTGSRTVTVKAKARNGIAADSPIATATYTIH